MVSISTYILLLGQLLTKCKYIILQVITLVNTVLLAIAKSVGEQFDSFRYGYDVLLPEVRITIITPFPRTVDMIIIYF